MEEEPKSDGFISTKKKLAISMLVGALGFGFAWLIASSDYSIPPKPELDLDEGDTEYSTPEFLYVPSHLMKKVREEGSILLHWVDELGKYRFKTARKFEAQEVLVDEE